MKQTGEAGYNERLFSGGFRTRLHLARFHWLARTLRDHRIPCPSVIELGCFDGRAHGFLPETPTHYLGLDANWENGLDLARDSIGSLPGVELHACETPDQLRALARGRRFSTAVSLETLEHVPPPLMDDYVQALAECTTGHIAVSVPNEKGLFFLAKYTAKRILRGGGQHYEPREVLAATMGRMDKVERNEHKGFDYQTVIRCVAEHFDLVAVNSIPFTRAPKLSGTGVGILARARNS